MIFFLNFITLTAIFKITCFFQDVLSLQFKFTQFLILFNQFVFHIQPLIYLFYSI